MTQHKRPDLGYRNDRPSLLEMGNRACHRLQDAGFGFGDEFHRSHRTLLPVLPHRCGSLLHRVETRQRRRPSQPPALVLREDRSLVARRRGFPARCRIHGPRRLEGRLVACQSQSLGALPPLWHQLVETRLHLAPARVERRLLRRLLRHAAGRASPGTQGSPGAFRRRRPATRAS